MQKNSKFTDMNTLWTDAQQLGLQVTSDRVIYKGVVFQMEEDSLKILSGQTEFYDPLHKEELSVFLSDGVEAGVKNFLVNKYTKKIDKCSRMIQQELATRRNQKRIEYLKSMRNEFTERIATL